MSVLLPLYGKTSDMELTSTKTGVPKEKGSEACAPAPPTLRVPWYVMDASS